MDCLITLVFYNLALSLILLIKSIITTEDYIMEGGRKQTHAELVPLAKMRGYNKMSNRTKYDFPFRTKVLKEAGTQVAKSSKSIILLPKL